MALAMAEGASAFPGRVHEKQLEEVFARVESEDFHRAAGEISSAMDNGLPESFRRAIGKVPGNLGEHRIIGHGWTLDGEIPKSVLAELERAHPGRKADIVAWWGKESKRLVAGMEKATGLPAKQAKALAGLQWDFHLLGDRMPGNTAVDAVLPPKAIARNIEKNCQILFKSRPEYAKAVGKSLRGALKAGGTESEQAARLMKTLQKEIPFSEMLSRCWGRMLSKRGIRISPATMESVRVDSFLERAKVSVPKTRASEARAKAGKGKGGKGGGKTAGTAGKTASKGVKAASRAAKAFGMALPVAIETGFFFYHEKQNRDAFERGEQTAEETECITYENVGRHSAALALGTAGAVGGAKGGALIGTGAAPGMGTAIGGVAGGIVGGIAGGIIGEIGGATAGEKMYVAKAEKGAEKGDPAAVFFLGGYHYKRIEDGKTKHVQEALEYLSRVQITTNGGISKANVFLGEMAWNGIGQKPDKEKAVALWRVAAALNDEDAMYLLARSALAGEGMEQNIEEGHAMMREAAARGCELAIDEYPETARVYRQWLVARRIRVWSIGGVFAFIVLLAGIGLRRKGKRAA